MAGATVSGCGFAAEAGNGQAAGGQGVLFADADHPVGEAFGGRGLGKGCRYALGQDEVADQAGHEGGTLGGGAAADAGVDDVVFDAPDGGEEGVDGNAAGKRPGGRAIWWLVGKMRFFQ